MKTAFLILAHQQPGMLHRLVSRLPADSQVFVHLGTSTPIHDFLFIQNDFRERVNFIDTRVTCRWGGFSLVQATINLLQAAGSGFDYYVLLSGQDYPIVSGAQIRAFFEAHNGSSFIEFDPLPSQKLNERQQGLYRINRFHYAYKKEHREFPPFSRKPVLNPLFNAWANGYHRFVRPMPMNMKPYWGSQWWMLHQNAVRHIHQLLQNSQVISFFRHTWIPDEIFFQTLLLHSDEALQQTLVNKNYRFLVWPTEGDILGFVHHPEVLSEKHMPLIAASDCLFARKFDENGSRRVLDWIDEKIGCR